TPLNGIIGFSDLLLDPSMCTINEQQREYVTDIVGAGRHLLALINDILDLAKISAGQLQMRAEPVSCAAVIADAVHAVTQEADRARVVIVQEVDASLPLLAGDGARLTQ